MPRDAPVQWFDPLFPLRACDVGEPFHCIIWSPRESYTVNTLMLELPWHSSESFIITRDQSLPSWRDGADKWEMRIKSQLLWTPPIRQRPFWNAFEGTHCKCKLPAMDKHG